MLRKFLHDSAAYSIPNFVSSGLSILLIPLYTRVLSPADYGSLDLFMAFLTIVKLTIPLEISHGVARHFADEKNPIQQSQLASTAFWFTVLVYSSFALFCMANAERLSTYIMGRSGLTSTFVLGIVYLWLNGVFYPIQNQFRWELRSKLFALISLLMTFATVASCVTLAYGFSLGLDGMLIGMSVGSAFGVIVGLAILLRSTFRLTFCWAQLKKMLVFSIPFVPASLALWATAWIDRVMIGHYLTLDDVGLYGIGSRVAGIAGIAISGVAASVTPLVYRYYENPDAPTQFARIFRVFIAASLILFLGLSLFSRDIVELFTSPSFYAGHVVVIYLVPANIISCLAAFTPGITIRKKTHISVWIHFAGGALSVLLNFALIPRFGITGAALANLIGRATVFACYAVISHRLYPIPHDWIRLSCSALVAVLLALLVPTISEIDWVRWILGTTALCVLVVSYLPLGLVTLSEVADLRRRMMMGWRIGAS